jgi:hypothetical protein
MLYKLHYVQQRVPDAGGNSRKVLRACAMDIILANAAIPGNDTESWGQLWHCLLIAVSDYPDIP